MLWNASEVKEKKKSNWSKPQEEGGICQDKLLPETV